MFGCDCLGGCRGSRHKSIVVVYEHQNFNLGLSNHGADEAIEVLPNRCVNLNRDNVKIAGIAPIHGCVKVWEHRDCKGASMCVCKGSEELTEDKMRDGINWNDKISSMSRC